MTKEELSGRAPAVAFLLTQVGSYAARRFAEFLEPLGLAPHHAGILRVLDRSAGLSQQDLAKMLGMHASRLVAVIDEMESRELVAREGNENDRRSYSLRVTAKGREALQAIARVGKEHTESLLAPLQPQERAQLGQLLQRLADAHGLQPGIHPGYAAMGKRP